VRVTSPAGRALPREPVHPGGLAEMLAADLSALGLADVPDALAGLVPGAGFAVRYLLVVEPVVTDGELLRVDLAAMRRTLATNAQRLKD